MSGVRCFCRSRESAGEPTVKKAGAGQRGGVRRASTAQSDLLWSARRVIGYRKRTRRTTRAPGCKRHTDVAAGRRWQTPYAIIRLSEAAGGRNAPDVQCNGSIVAERKRARRSRRTHEFGTKEHALSRERGIRSGNQTHTAQAHRLRTTGRVIGDRQDGSTRARLTGREGQVDRATCARRKGRPACGTVLCELPGVAVGWVRHV